MNDKENYYSIYTAAYVGASKSAQFINFHKGHYYNYYYDDVLQKRDKKKLVYFMECSSGECKGYETTRPEVKIEEYI